MTETFSAPSDITQWWEAPHCGPGTLDSNEVCGYCGFIHIECAERDTREIAKSHKIICGGSGFWCYKCGRFWAQDTCGESYGIEYKACDNKKLELREDTVYCCCGAKLFKEVCYEDYDPNEVDNV